MDKNKLQQDLNKKISQIEELIRSFDSRLNHLEKHMLEKKPSTRGVMSAAHKPVLDQED